jgi:hypothetical protein
LSFSIVVVDLARGEASVEGAVALDAAISAVKDEGYDARTAA